MPPREDLDPPHKSLNYLLTGYSLVVIGVLITAVTTLGSFESPESPGPIAVGTALAINSLGFIVVVFSQVWYLKNRGHLLILDKKILDTPIKYVVTFVAVIIPILGSIGFVYTNIYDKVPETSEVNLFFIVIGIIFLAVPTLIVFGILIFNILFIFVGPIYMLTFYYFVVRRSVSR